MSAAWGWAAEVGLTSSSSSEVSEWSSVSLTLLLGMASVLGKVVVRVGNKRKATRCHLKKRLATLRRHTEQHARARGANRVRHTRQMAVLFVCFRLFIIRL